MTSPANPEVLFTTERGIGRITLNRQNDPTTADQAADVQVVDVAQMLLAGVKGGNSSPHHPH